MASQNDVINIIVTDSYVTDGKNLMNDIRGWGAEGIRQWTGSDGGPIKVNYIHVGTDFPYGGTVTGSLPDHIYQVQVGKNKIAKTYTVDRATMIAGPNSEITSSVKTKRGTPQSHTSGQQQGGGGPSG
tara:strand:- start:63 stop:446 length:384 start_codon:yes stop_codon:yes gene_type:complete